MFQPDEAISPVATVHPELTISPAAINATPVELDGTPASHEKRRAERQGSRHDMSPVELERRAKLLEQRKHDPAVVVDIPQIPGAEELEKTGGFGLDAIIAKS